MRCMRCRAAPNRSKAGFDLDGFLTHPFRGLGWGTTTPTLGECRTTYPTKRLVGCRLGYVTYPAKIREFSAQKRPKNEKTRPTGGKPSGAGAKIWPTVKRAPTPARRQNEVDSRFGTMPRFYHGPVREMRSGLPTREVFHANH